VIIAVQGSLKLQVTSARIIKFEGAVNCDEEQENEP
jgi:hypothetical protein